MNEFVNNLEPCPTLSTVSMCAIIWITMLKAVIFALFKDPSDKYLKFYLVHSWFVTCIASAKH